MTEKEADLLKKKAKNKPLSLFLKQLIFTQLNKQKTLLQYFKPNPFFNDHFIDKLAEKLAKELSKQLVITGTQVTTKLTRKKIEEKLKKDDIKAQLMKELKEILSKRREKLISH